MLTVRRSTAIAALIALTELAACSGSDALRPGGGEASLMVRADVAGTPVALVVVEVSAPDIAPSLVFNITITSGVATGTITIPAGSNRAIAMRAYDAGGVLTHEGSTTVNVQAGTNPSISITLTPLSGGIEIHATLGSFAVTVTPTPNSLSLSGATTVPLTAIIVDEKGHVVADTVSWATQNPGVASVTGNAAATPGLVTAVGLGQTHVLATYHGAVGSVAITVTP